MEFLTVMSAAALLDPLSLQQQQQSLGKVKNAAAKGHAVVSQAEFRVSQKSHGSSAKATPL